jgi:hypothetical protein
LEEEQEVQQTEDSKLQRQTLAVEVLAEGLKAHPAELAVLAE